MKKTILAFILFSCLANCRFLRDYESEKTISPTSKYYLTTTVNRTNQAKDDYANVVIHLYGSDGQLKSDFNTHAGDANKWAVGWNTKKDTIILFSSDIGNSAYRIENEQLKSVDLTDELNKRAIQLKYEKYKE
jgi:hypothetical protein